MNISIVRSGLATWRPNLQQFVGVGLLAAAFAASANTNLVVNGGF